ncbi:MAG: tetratricopeptide repeat protein [Acidobacteriota bacterium]
MKTSAFRLAIVLLLAGAAIAPAGAARLTDAALDARLSTAYSAMYNLDRDVALSTARQAVASAPAVSRAHRTLAMVLWLEALFQRGAVTVDNYLGGLTKSQLALPKPQPALDTEFKQELNRAITLADMQLHRSPRDVTAMHDLGSALGLQASYMASVEGSVMAAFGPARRAFDLEERVLGRDPNQVDAGTIVGTYRYSVSSLGVTARMMAYLAGFGGGKERGISLIEAASRRGNGQTEARTALILIYSREGRHLDAFHLLGQMVAEFPRNRLFVLEQGAAAIRAGRAEEAEAILTRGVAAFDHDNRAKIPGERALWLYKRASARVSLNHLADAQADLAEALTSGPVDWVRGRINFELGRVADLRGQRAEALTRYRAARDIGQLANDPIVVADALRFIQRPFAMPKEPA